MEQSNTEYVNVQDRGNTSWEYNMIQNYVNKPNITYSGNKTSVKTVLPRVLMDNRKNIYFTKK